MITKRPTLHLPCSESEEIFAMISGSGHIYLEMNKKVGNVKSLNGGCVLLTKEEAKQLGEWLIDQSKDKEE